MNDATEAWGVQLRRWRDETQRWSQQDLVDHLVQLAYQTNEERGTRLEVRLVGRWENGSVGRPQAVYRRLLGQLGAPLPRTTITATTTEPREPVGRTADAQTPNLPVRSDHDAPDQPATNSQPEEALPLVSPHVVEAGPDGRAGARDSTALIATDFLWTPERAGDEYVADVRACIASLVSVDNQFGGAEVSRLSETVFDAVRRRLGSRDYELSVRTDLMASVGELAEVAGWLAYDANRQDVARRMNQEALYFTRLAGDRSMELFTLQNASMHSGFMNQPGEALDIADMVLESGYRLTSRIRALFLTRKARALAQIGAASAPNLFGEIRSLFLDGLDDADPAWAWWIDEREILWHEAMCRKDLGDNRTAVDMFERSVEAATTGDARSDYIHRAYLLGGQVLARSWHSAEATLSDLEPFAVSVASPRSVLVIRTALADLQRPDLCAPRHLRDHADRFDRFLVGRMAHRGT